MANVSDWIQELTDHGFEDTTETRKVALLNATLSDVCAREPWPFLQKTIQLSFDGTSGKASNFPSDFRALLALTDPSTGRTINWERADVLRKRFASQWSLVDSPTYCYDEAGIIRAYPIPTSGYKLDAFYICTHPQVMPAVADRMDAIVHGKPPADPYAATPQYTARLKAAVKR